MEEIAIGEQKTPRKAWGMLAVAYLASFVAPLCQFNIPPLADFIIPQILVPLTGGDAVAISTQFGLLMSVLGIIGLILAFPAAYIARSWGAKNTVLISVAFLLVGSLIQSIWGDSFIVLLVGRFLHGVGLGLVGVVGPTCVSVWFPDKTRGIALGLWATWVPLSMVIIYAIGPVMATAWGFKSVFWLCTIMCAIALVLFWVFFKMPDGEAGDFSVAGSFKDTLHLFKRPDLWLLGFIMAIFMFINTGALATYYNTFLTSIHGWEAAPASQMVSIYTAIGIIAGPVAGKISDRFVPKNKRWLIVVTFALLTIGLFIAFPQSGAGNATMMIWIFIVVGGIASGMGSGTIRPLAPIVAGGGAMGAATGMAMIQFMSNVGTAAGSPIFAALYATVGWDKAALYLLIPLAIIALILAIIMKPGVDRKANKAE